jgi:hypothetical protein
MIQIFFVLMFAATFLFSSIKEIAYFTELKESITSDALVLIDIDDTLIIPTQMLGSDTWFERRIKKYQSDGNDFQIALEKALSEWEAIQHLSRMELVEPDICDVVSQIQKRGIALMGITARGLALATRSVIQLRDLQIDLNQTSPHGKDCCFPVQGHTVLYREGILFTSGKSKGESFFQFCDSIGKTPTRIVAIDDKVTHLQSLEKEAHKRGVEFIGLRYGFSDQKKSSYSQEIADYQISHSTLLHLVTDDEAIEKIKGIESVYRS